jgi:uncharacterized protein
MVDSLLQPTVTWTDLNGNTCPMTRDDILVVAPYNAQVAALSARLPVRVGTVDRFQGQEAAVVIYALTSSSPEDASRVWNSSTAEIGSMLHYHVRERSQLSSEV